MALQLGNSIAGSDSVDMGRRGFLRFGAATGATLILATTTGCASHLLSSDIQREKLKELIIGKPMMVFGSIKEQMPPNIEIVGPDPLTGDYSIEHPKLSLITSTPIRVHPNGKFPKQEAIADGDRFFLEVASKRYGQIEKNSRFTIREADGIIYIERVPA